MENTQGISIRRERIDSIGTSPILKQNIYIFKAYIQCYVAVAVLFCFVVLVITPIINRRTEETFYISIFQTFIRCSFPNDNLLISY